MPFPRPKPDEQQRIADCLIAQDRLIEAEAHQLTKLQQLKSGLMADLLTGRVRVPEGVVKAP
jgi:type I restriction enzyme, S subunit